MIQDWKSGHLAAYPAFSQHGTQVRTHRTMIGAYCFSQSSPKQALPIDVRVSSLWSSSLIAQEQCSTLRKAFAKERSHSSRVAAAASATIHYSFRPATTKRLASYRIQSRTAS